MDRKLGTTGTTGDAAGRGENAGLATVTRYARAAGYRARILLKPEDGADHHHHTVGRRSQSVQKTVNVTRSGSV